MLFDNGAVTMQLLIEFFVEIALTVEVAFYFAKSLIDDNLLHPLKQNTLEFEVFEVADIPHDFNDLEDLIECQHALFFKMHKNGIESGTFWRSIELELVKRFDIAKMQFLISLYIQRVLTREELFELFDMLGNVEFVYKLLDMHTMLFLVGSFLILANFSIEYDKIRPIFQHTGLLMKHLVMLFLPLSFLFAAVDINTATFEELVSLKKIGPKKAARIIKYRMKHGCFKDLEEFKKVKGVNKKTIEKNKGNIRVSKCEK